MRVYHFVNAVYGLEDVAKRRLKVATIGELNDPFELLAWAFSSPEGRKALRATKAELSSTFGFLCFSLDWRNPVQWSHYADRHRGLCLGFDVPEELLVRVRYRAHRLAPNEHRLLSGGPAASDEMLAGLSTKYVHWRYEREARIHVGLEEKDKVSGLYFAPFGAELSLRQVVVGSESDLSRAEVADALGDLSSEVDVFQSRLAFKSFRVVKQRKAQFWV